MKYFAIAVVVMLIQGCSDNPKISKNAKTPEDILVAVAGLSVEEMENQGNPKGLAQKAGAQLLMQLAATVPDVISNANCDTEKLKKIGSAMNSKDTIEMGLNYETILVDVAKQNCVSGKLTQEKQNEWFDLVMNKYYEKYELANL